MKFLKRVSALTLTALITLPNLVLAGGSRDFTPRRNNKLILCPVDQPQVNRNSSPSEHFGGIYEEGTEANQIAWQIFDTLTLELGFSGAAASGVMANIKYESGFVPDAAEVYDRTNSRQIRVSNGVEPAGRQGGVLRFGMLNKKPVNGMAKYTDIDGHGGGGLVQFTPYERFTESEFWTDQTGWDGKQLLKY